MPKTGYYERKRIRIQRCKLKKHNEYIDNRKEKNFKIREKCFVYISQIVLSLRINNSTRKSPPNFSITLYIHQVARARNRQHNPLYNCLDTKSCARKTPFPYVPRSLCLFFHVRASRPLNWIYLGRRLTVHTIVYLSSKIRGNADPPGRGGRNNRTHASFRFHLYVCFRYLAPMVVMKRD